MLKKRIFAFVLVAAMVAVLFSGCGESNAYVYFGDEITKDTLRICMDSRHIASTDSYELGKELDVLIPQIKNACGIEKLAIEVIPGKGAERKTKLQRLRTEIMAGSGPDVFLMRSVTGSYEFGEEESLFNFPEKNMETGLFLPLDEYMENHSRLTDWSMQTKAVLDAGRTDEGQVVIPMTYTFPVLIYPENEVKMDYSSILTMQEILENPETASLGSVLYSDMTRSDEFGDQSRRTNQIFYSLGKFADYKDEELLFTEEELYDVIVTMNGLHDAVEENRAQYINTEAGYGMIYDIGLEYFDTEMTLVPIYSIDGGVTVSVQSYAAINCATKLPEEAFAVIDYVMSEEAQCGSMLYSSFYGGLPLQNDLGSAEKMLHVNQGTERYLAESYFKDLLTIKENITAVNFENKIDYMLLVLMREYLDSGTISRENVSETYEKMQRMIRE